MSKCPAQLAIILTCPPEKIIGESIFDGGGNPIGWVADDVDRSDELDEPDTLKLHDRMNAALLDYESALGIEGGNGAKTVPLVIEMHRIIEDAAKAGVGTCHYNPDDVGFTWWDENDVEHYEEYSASDECYLASCDKCGFSMMVGEEGWFDGWDEITEWTEEDGSEHKGYVLKPRFKHCPRCGRSVTE